MRILFVNTSSNSDYNLLNWVIDKSNYMQKTPFKISSTVTWAQSIDQLYPPKELLVTLHNENETLFTNLYFDYVFKNDEIFKVLMQVIIELEERDYTFILASYNQYTYMVLDELMNLIKIRYGINCYLINEFSDIDENIIPHVNFKSLQYRNNYFYDIDRYIKLVGYIYKTSKEIENENEDKTILNNLYYNNDYMGGEYDR